LNGPTAESLATEHGVSPRTIKRDGAFARAVERLKIGREVMAGAVRAPRSAVIEAARDLPSGASPEAIGKIRAGIINLPRVAYILLDGHNRFEICQRRKLPYEITPIDLGDRLDAKIWIHRNQLGRRNLTDDQRAMNADALRELESQQAMRERAKAGGKTGGRGRPKADSSETASVSKLSDKMFASVVSVCKTEGCKYFQKYVPIKKMVPGDGVWECPECGYGLAVMRSEEPEKPETERTRKAAAKRAGVSERKMRQAQAVRKASPELAAQVLAGEIDLAAATREIKRKAVVANLDDVSKREAKRVEGVFDVIVLDPPWPMEKIERDARPNQVAFDYPTMSEDELRALAVPVATDCHVWLWTTHRFLPMALRLLAAWGLTYRLHLLWHKPGGFHRPAGRRRRGAQEAPRR